MNSHQGIVALLSDFGEQDGYVAAMKGVLLSVDSELKLVDISHGVRPFDIEQASFVLESCFLTFPSSTVFLTVVDPGVGSSRKGIIVVAKNYWFIGPDNGLFSFLTQYESGLRTYEIHAQIMKRPLSATFHGRDLFAPAAALIASGHPPTAIANRVEPDTLDSFRRPTSSTAAAGDGRVVHIDHFGNMITNIRIHEADRQQPDDLEVYLGKKRIGPLHRTYAEAPEGELIAVEGSSGFIEIAVHQGSAADTLEYSERALPVSVRLSTYNT